MSDVLIDRPELEGLGVYEFGWADSDAAGASARRGISAQVVEDISHRKSEPAWMLKNRLKGLTMFERKPMPTWGADLSEIDFDNIFYYVKPSESRARDWDEVPESIKTPGLRRGDGEGGRSERGGPGSE